MRPPAGTPARDGATRVYCDPATRASAYVPLLFQGIEDRYEAVYREDGTLEDAARELDAGRDVVVHVHWEEFVLRDCDSEASADEAAAVFARRIAAIRSRAGPIVWTIHNERPHLIRFDRPFLAMRATLAEAASAILVHNATSVDVLAAQVALDRTKLRSIPHPSYLGRHEDEASLLAGLALPHERRIQGFGWIRRQKGFAEMIDMLPAAYLSARGARVRISGEGVEAAAVIAALPGRGDVEWDLRHVPDGEIPQLLRSAVCVILPYERVLTSGVALLAMSAGAMLVAVDIPQLRDLLPSESRRFLYPRGDGVALRRVLDELFAIPARTRRAIIEANLAVARDLHPARIARRVAAVYDEVRAERRARASGRLS